MAYEASGIVHRIAGCYTCGKSWQTKNCLGVAARHARAHGHHTWAEQTLSVSYNYEPGAKWSGPKSTDEKEEADEGTTPDIQKG